MPANILVSSLPSHVDVGGTQHEMNVDFRSALLVILAFEDDELTIAEKTTVMLGNLFVEMPVDLQAALQKAQWFLNAGKDNDDVDSGPKTYSFSHDADLIYAAFMQTHGIDLSKSSMHWWKFLALFMDLGANTTFCSLVGLRLRVANGTATKEEVKMARGMGDMFEIPQPDTRTAEEKAMADEFLKLVNKEK